MASHRRLQVPLGGRLAVPGEAECSEAPGFYSICSLCHGPAAAAHRICWSCRVVTGQLGTPPPVVPVFLFGLGSPVHRALVGYKASSSEPARSARAEALTEMLAAWLHAHAGCLLGGATSALVVPVPSSSGGRPSWHGRHPLVSLCEAAVAGSDQLSTSAVLRPGPRPPCRLQASAAGYRLEPSADVRGRTAVVVDDMFVSGSRVLSAAAALSRAGARVAAVVPVGRLVRPDHNEATAAFWTARRRLAFDPCMCARCSAQRLSDRSSPWPIRLPGVSERLAA